jgi:hypothetical protein
MFFSKLFKINVEKLLGAGTAANTFIGCAFVGAFVAAVQFAVFFNRVDFFYFTSALATFASYFCHDRSPLLVF